ncbi:DUF6152 family protein [Bowmanella dokdonensis]|uniref:DUF6152 family protein n=1 Tax=Bowmanella dokdonensis TaxID=751969 RepID=UPI0034DDEF23
MIAFLALITTVTAQAHHSSAGFDRTELIELKGKLIGFESDEPHSVLFVEVKAPDGSSTTWEIEAGATRQILVSGITRDFLGSEPPVSVTAFRSYNESCQPRCLAAGRSFDFGRWLLTFN